MLWKLLMFVAALAALYHLSEISGDIADIRKASVKPNASQKLTEEGTPQPRAGTNNSTGKPSFLGS